MTINSATNINDTDLNNFYIKMLKDEMKKAKDFSIRNKAEYVIVINCRVQKK